MGDNYVDKHRTPVTFKVTGAFLPSTAILAISDAVCEAPKNHTAISFEQVCTLQGNSTNRTITVKTNTQANGGSVISDNLTISLQNSSKSTLTATGITWCANDNTNNLACNAQSLGAYFGLMQDGEVQAGQPMTYDKRFYNNEECIVDKVTGLTWEQKTDDGGLRDKDNTYTWYNTDSTNNGGSAGYENGGKNTQAYIVQLNASNYCGYNNWRLPSQDELQSIVDYGRFNPAINPIFSNTQSSYYWSSSPIAAYNNLAWGVTFSNGGDSYSTKSNSHYVRAVR